MCIIYHKYGYFFHFFNMNIISMDLKSISRSLAASDSQTRLEGFSRTFKYISENDLIYTDILKL